jgi:hypothetical protein
MPTVSGRVIDPRGVTVPASLSAVSNGNGVDADARGVFVGMQTGGEFRVTLSPGEYTLVAQSFEMTALTQLTVDRADVSGIDLVLVKGAQVSGRVIFDGTAARPGGLAVAASCAGQRNVDFADVTRRPGRVQPNGSFSLSNLIGTCELGLTPEPREWRIKSIRAAGRDLLDVPIAFTGGADLRDVQIVLTDRRAELGGTIAGAPPAAFAGTLSVLVFPDDPRQIGRRAQWVRPDQHGRFVVSNLTPGVYLVALATDVDDTRWQTADYLDGLRSAAARVTLGDGETQSITLRWGDSR